MKRLGGLWPRLITFSNLLEAYRKARLGKRRRPDVLAFELDLETELIELQRQLTDSSYRPGDYRLFSIYERKPRTIAAAPFRDRVVHHALMNVIEPPLDRTFIDHSYACRTGRGVHRAVAQYQRRAHRYAYVLKLDIEKYFHSIDRGILKQELYRRIKDRNVLVLLERIIDCGPHVKPQLRYFSGDDLLTPLERQIGIPIGNLTSQFFANLYLDHFDHFMQERSGAHAYLRYVDDMVVLGDDKRELWRIRQRVADYLESLRLRLHPCKAHIFRVSDGVDFLGYRVFRNRILLRNENGRRFARRLRTLARLYAEGSIGFADINPSVQSWIGHAVHADTLGLRRKVFSGVLFSRGTGRTMASA